MYSLLSKAFFFPSKESINIKINTRHFHWKAPVDNLKWVFCIGIVPLHFCDRNIFILDVTDQVDQIGCWTVGRFAAKSACRLLCSLTVGKPQCDKTPDPTNHHPSYPNLHQFSLTHQACISSPSYPSSARLSLNLWDSQTCLFVHIWPSPYHSFLNTIPYVPLPVH